MSGVNSKRVFVVKPPPSVNLIEISAPVSLPCRLRSSNRRFDLRHIGPVRLNALE